MPSDIPPTATSISDEDVRVMPPVGAGTAISDTAWNTAVGAWIAADIRSSPIAQTSAAWNHFQDSLPKFRAHLEAALKA